MCGHFAGTTHQRGKQFVFDRCQVYFGAFDEHAMGRQIDLEVFEFQYRTLRVTCSHVAISQGGANTGQKLRGAEWFGR